MAICQRQKKQEGIRKQDMSKMESIRAERPSAHSDANVLGRGMGDVFRPPREEAIHRRVLSVLGSRRGEEVAIEAWPCGRKIM